LADTIKKHNNHIEIEFIKSSGGVFEVSCDGRLLFSKKALDRFPNPDEIMTKL
jgi:selT/selW/selH-like putative selenoprotein